MVEAFLIVGIIACLVILASSAEVRDALTPKTSKNLNSVLDTEMIYLEPMGLDTFYPEKTIHSLRFPHNSMQEVTFYHPQYLFSTPYDFNSENTYATQGTYVSMRSLINVAPNKFKEHVKKIKYNVQSFKKENQLEYVESKTLVPLMYIFGKDINKIKDALDSEIHPAVLAAIISKHGEHIMEELKESKNLPIEWLSKIYDFEYVTKTRETFKVI
jgi:hypothetical protein